MIRIVPMTDAHVLAIVPQEQQAPELRTPEDRLREISAPRAAGSAWAVVDGDEVLLLGGVQTMWEGRGMAWVLLAEGAGRRMLSITRAVRRYLDALDYGRLEMYVDAGFWNGCRWAEVLGFRNETPQGMAGFLPNGNRAYMFGRAR
jgi:hypothetical protein